MELKELMKTFAGWVKEFSGETIEDRLLKKQQKICRDKKNFDWWNPKNENYFGCSPHEWKNSGELACIVFYNNNGNKIAITLQQNNGEYAKPISEDLTEIRQRFAKLFENTGIEENYYRIKNFDEDLDNAFLEEINGIITDKSRQEAALVCEIIHLDNESTQAIELNKMRAFLAEYANLRNWGKDDVERRKKIDEVRKQQLTDDVYDDIIKYIEGGVHQIIFTGAPGTGKTYIAKEIAERLGGLLPKTDGKPARYEFVQFHPSYDYTDFVEGLRPVDVGEGEIKFVKLDGIFKNFCRQVAKKNEEFGNEKALYFFIIDEINRADLSKVFGELMFCLEKDKRGKTIDTQYHNLPDYHIKGGKAEQIKDNVFEAGFYIPKNVVIIGTMNDIDRSVESMDFALRRRFTWKEFVVADDDTGKDNLKKTLESMGFDESMATGLSKSIIALNGTIRDEGAQFGLDRQYYISQGHFANLPDTVDKTDLNKIIGHVWDYHIESLLREYVRGENSSKVKDFIKDCKTAFETGKPVKKDGQNG